MSVVCLLMVRVLLFAKCQMFLVCIVPLRFPLLLTNQSKKRDSLLHAERTISLDVTKLHFLFFPTASQTEAVVSDEETITLWFSAFGPRCKTRAQSLKGFRSVSDSLRNSNSVLHSRCVCPSVCLCHWTWLTAHTLVPPPPSPPLFIPCSSSGK